jgi:hypothetical protein
MGTVERLVQAIGVDLRELLPEMYKNPREKLATMVACLIETRSCNTMELAARLPLQTERAESRYAWIERFLSAETIDDLAVMETLSRRLLATLSKQGQTIVVSLDQTALDKERAIGMLSARGPYPCSGLSNAPAATSPSKSIYRCCKGSNPVCQTERKSLRWQTDFLVRRS